MVIGVIGGGASGMAAALAAAEKEENQVILMERQARVGRKLQATGNGRCNLTNLHAGERGYHGEDAAFAGSGNWDYSRFGRNPGGCIPTPIRQILWWMCCGLLWKDPILPKNWGLKWKK